MAISVGPTLCVAAMGVANAQANFVYSPCNIKAVNFGRGNLRRFRRSQGHSDLRGFARIVVGRSRNGLFERECVGRLSVRASRSEDEKDLRFAQQVRERSDSEGEEERIGEASVSATSVSTSHEEHFVVPDIGSRRRFRNRFLGLVKLRTNIAEAAEGIFKSEIRRRIFVTIVLLMASRAGYFVPLPGFDRRSMPGDYLGFVSGAVEELGDAVSELKLSVFQLGISPYILSSIVMQVSCHLVPALVKLRKEGIDGNEKIKKYTFVSYPFSCFSHVCTVGKSQLKSIACVELALIV